MSVTEKVEEITGVNQKNYLCPSEKYDRFTQQLQSHLETQDELMIDFSSLKSCLNPTGFIPENKQGEEISDKV